MQAQLPSQLHWMQALLQLPYQLNRLLARLRMSCAWAKEVLMLQSLYVRPNTVLWDWVITGSNSSNGRRKPTEILAYVYDTETTAAFERFLPWP